MNVHFLGIGGAGSSAIAAIAQSRGYTVSGCDNNIDNEFTKVFASDQLKKGHSADHLEGVDILAITPAILSLDPDNPELVEARKNGVRVMTWQEFMGEYLEKEKFVIAVCGTHGKSTTTAMIAKLMTDGGLDPTVEVGALIGEWGSNFRIGQSKYFVTEADEFNDNFLVTHPDIAVVTSIEMDHPEYFRDFDAYLDSFEKFLSQTKSLIVANLNDEWVAEVIKQVMKHSKVTVIDYSKSEYGLKLRVNGTHNLLNAKAAASVGISLGLEWKDVQRSLEDFRGIGRRSELIGRVGKVDVISDFGHHPTEITKTMEGIGEKYDLTRAILVYQPHMFSRTKYLFNDFVKVFKNLRVKSVYIMDIFPSREVDTGIVSSHEIVTAIDKKKVRYLDSIENFELDSETSAVVFMGAGTIDKIAREWVAKYG